jgi:predicted DNA repair protein MutK
VPTSAFFAVLRDTAKLAALAADDVAKQGAKLAAAADDIAVLTGRAAAKTAGIAVDDLAVGASKMTGVSPARELPAILAIFKWSAINKVWLVALVLAVSVWAPPVITVALVLGGLYLASEGGKALLQRLGVGGKGDAVQLSEADKIKGAIRTDVVLSLEILVISLAAVGEVPLAHKAAVLVAMSVLMTVGIYGLVAVLVRLDDWGLQLAQSASATRQALGRRIVAIAPRILSALDPIGMVAMLAVAGGIFTHLVHLNYPHWSVALLGDTLVGAVIGVLLAGGVYLVGRSRRAAA